jgi:hypothetical protein
LIERKRHRTLYTMQPHRLPRIRLPLRRHVVLGLTKSAIGFSNAPPSYPNNVRRPPTSTILLAIDNFCASVNFVLFILKFVVFVFSICFLLSAICYACKICFFRIGTGKQANSGSKRHSKADSKANSKCNRNRPLATSNKR